MPFIADEDRHILLFIGPMQNIYIHARDYSPYAAAGAVFAAAVPPHTRCRHRLSPGAAGMPPTLTQWGRHTIRGHSILIQALWRHCCCGLFSRALSAYAWRALLTAATSARRHIAVIEPAAPQAFGSPPTRFRWLAYFIYFYDAPRRREARRCRRDDGRWAAPKRCYILMQNNKKPTIAWGCRCHDAYITIRFLRHFSLYQVLFRHVKSASPH